MSWGAITVTFLLLAGMVPGSRNCLHVIDEIHEMRSPSSVSGLRFSLTMRLPAGNFRHELNSFSPASSAPPLGGVAAGAATDGDGDGIGGAGGGGGIAATAFGGIAAAASGFCS